MVDTSQLQPPFENDARAFPRPARGEAWTIVMVCIGLGLIACCIILPQADANRRLAYEREKLKADLQHIERQITLNDEFLHRVADDPALAERLAQRQMKLIRRGTSPLDLTGPPVGWEMSPFLLLNLPPPPAMGPYEAKGGWLGKLLEYPRSQRYVLGVGLMLVACGLVLGSDSRRD